jgi:hypothetical protein
MKNIFYFLIIIFLFSCNDNNNQLTDNSTKEYYNSIVENTSFNIENYIEELDTNPIYKRFCWEGVKFSDLEYVTIPCYALSEPGCQTYDELIDYLKPVKDWAVLLAYQNNNILGVITQTSYFWIIGSEKASDYEKYLNHVIDQAEGNPIFKIELMGKITFGSFVDGKLKLTSASYDENKQLQWKDITPEEVQSVLDQMPKNMEEVTLKNNQILKSGVNNQRRDTINKLIQTEEYELFMKEFKAAKSTEKHAVMKKYRQIFRNKLRK